LLPKIPLSYPGFFGIYLLAQLASIISNIPGGLGVFETVMLLLLSPPISSATLFSALLVYRGLYYLLPLIVATVMLIASELRLRLR
jgi:glycosyltransferase 2 family protein